MGDNGNNLRDENGALIGGLVVFDYLQGMKDFEDGLPPSDITSPSYDLGRQRAAEKKEGDMEARAWLDRQEAERMARMRSILPPDAFADLVKKLEEIKSGAHR